VVSGLSLPDRSALICKIATNAATIMTVMSANNLRSSR
jgi:hypothetical protein